MEIKKYFVFKNYLFYLKNLLRKDYRISYAQSGEDIIIENIFNILKISRPAYLDIGAFDPVHFSNTYLFYRKGCKGVLVEPDPLLCKKLKSKRKHDNVLNIGVGISDRHDADFFVMSSRTLNTFSKTEAEHLQENSKYKIEKVLKIPLEKVNNIIDKHFKTKPNLISLDTEGLDFEIIQSLDLIKFRPEVICVETRSYSENGESQYNQDIFNMMVEKGYFLYADTFINSIFIDRNIWVNNRQNEKNI